MPGKISSLNDPPRVLPGPPLLHNLIRWDMHGEACAIDFTSHNRRKRYTYRDIQSCAASLVTRIQSVLKQSEICQQGQHIVPILLPQSPGLYVSQLAILQSGGAFCPINLDAPKDRIKFVVGDVSATIIITTSEFQDIVSWENGPEIIIVDQIPTIPSEEEILNGSRATASNDLAYVMYTSGSSGTPKGVAVSHLAASQSLLAHESLIPPFKRFLQFAAPSFDVSVFEIFFPLTRGCTLVGCDRNQLLNDLPGRINMLTVDAVELTPTVVGALLQKRSNVPGLKLLLTIGEMLTRPIVEEFGGSDTHESILYGMYGPTEAAIHCTIHSTMQESAKPSNIGIPFETVSAFIAEACSSSEQYNEIRILPQGELGELILGGPQLAQGYLNGGEQNKAAFVTVENKSYYRTGDKAKILDDGTIEIHGRMSAGQVKLRGQRVELGEIEDAIYKHPSIKTVVAIVIGSVLVAFALVDVNTIKPNEVLDTCSRWLPSFMIPSEVVFLNEFPYLPSGKVDKKKLESDYKQKRSTDNDTMDLTPVGALVENVLHESLGLFPSNMRLAAAGLDSLVAIKVAARLRSHGLNVTTLAVLQAETQSSLIDICETSTDEPSSTKINTPITDSEEAYTDLDTGAQDLEICLPCTPLQIAMLAESAHSERAYQNWVELQLPGIADSKLLRSKLHHLTMHNPILRTGFKEASNSVGYTQFVRKSFPETQIEDVFAFSRSFNDTTNTSLQYPMKFEILSMDGPIKLLMHIHHALYDAWSLELILDDLNQLLRDESPFPRPSFAEVVYGYSDGSLCVDPRTSKDYWKDHLTHLELRKIPNFHPTKTTTTGLAVARLSTQLSTSEIEMAAKRMSVSSQAIFQAAYSLILSSYLGSSDICFGNVFSGRTLPIAGIENIVGPCLATLPIRVDVSIASTLQDLVQELHSTSRKHLGHDTLPLRDIRSVNGLGPRQALFDTLVIWQQTLHSYDHTREHVVLIDQVDHLEFNLTLEITPTSGNIEIKANYEQSVFPASQIETLLCQVEQVTKAIIKDADRHPSQVFDELEAGILSIENSAPITELGPETLTTPVERIAEEDPDRLAIAFADRILPGASNIHYMTYAQLNARANQYGHYLVNHQVLPDEIVCICLEKSHELYISILAAAKVGAGYLPVTPDVPQERLQQILQQARVKIMISHSTSRPLLQSFHDIEIVYIDELDWSTFPKNNLCSAFKPEHLSYCVLTSGSTGTPKGVLVTQGNLLSNLDVLLELYPASKDSRLLQSCSQAFDVSVFEIFFTWRIGGCLCSATKDVLFRDIEHAIRIFDVTHLSLTPTVAALIQPENVPKVEFLVTAGEAVTQKVFNIWADRGLYQGYGPSETTNICTVKPRVTKHDHINNIGLPFRNTSAFVVARGPEFSLVPRGGEGEFCFGGSQVFRGYIGEAQNEGKIICHPKFGRLYRSGDFGRIMPNGSLAFTGRKDDQVKIRGQRVELLEINNVLLSLSQVEDCVAMVISADNNSQRLICFWTTGADDANDLYALDPKPDVLKVLYKKIEAKLPQYMVPSAMIPVSQLPTTSQGKIDKRRLVNLYESLDVKYLGLTAKVSKSSIDHTWTDLELEIRRILAQLTQTLLDDIGPETSFYSVGVDSISAIPFARTIREATDHQIEISDILKHSSVLRLAERISVCDIMEPVASWANTTFNFDRLFVDSTVAQFQKSGRKVQAVTPCTPLQEAMLSAAQSASDNAYSNHVLFNVFADIDKLLSCWKEMVRRHEILRTCFVQTDMPRHPYVQVALEEFQIVNRSLTASTMKDAIREIETRISSDEKIPPWTLHLAKFNDQQQLIISMHHALYDGVALAILYDEIEKLYHQQVHLPGVVSFTPFLQYMSSLNNSASDQFWESVLHGYRPISLDLANNKRDTTHQIPKVQKLTAKMPLSWIEDNAKKCSTTLLAACHATWAAVMSEELSSSDICFGNVVSGRTIPVDGIESLVAPCFNTIPARLKDLHNFTYIEAFRKLQKLNADSLPFQLTPLRRLQAKYSPDGFRLFDTLFILQQPPKELDASIWSIVEDIGAMDFPLVCEVVPKLNTDTLEVILHSNTPSLSECAQHNILERFVDFLEAALQNPRRQIVSASKKLQIFAKTEEREKNRSKAMKEETQHMIMSEKELEIRDIISKFTDVSVENISRDISIFRLGLDSISTVQVASRLRSHGHKILASDILQHPTIAQISTFIAKNGNNGDTKQIEFDFVAFDKQYRDAVCTRNGIAPSHVEAIRPCTPVQQGMIAQCLHSGGHEYLNSISLELLPGHSLDKVKDTWIMLCKVHDMLRTGFAQTENSQGPFVMITYSSDDFKVPWFEPNRPPLKAVDILRSPWSLNVTEDEDRAVLKLTMHHALYDAQSMQTIFSDFASLYEGKNVTKRPSMNPMLGSILHASGQDQEQKKAYWTQQENTILVNKFPDLTPLRVMESSNAVYEINSTSSIADLEGICRSLGVTMQAAGQATWARILMAYTGEKSTTFGMTLSGRSVCDEADTIAFPSIVTLPVKCNITGTNAELLSRNMSGNAQLHKHQFTPLTSIQKWSGYPERKLFDTLFAYQKLPDANNTSRLPWKVVDEEANVDYIVSLEVQPTANGALTLRLTFKEEVIPRQHAELLLKQYDALLLDTLQHPEHQCDVAPSIGDDLLSITPAQYSTLLDNVKLLHQYVERGARLWPEKIALEFATCLEPGKFATRKWTYRQLDIEANRVAQLIHSRGVSPGEIVAICFDKCAEASLAIIGIMKAGCGYLALDPNAPADRLNFIMKDSHAQLIITEGKSGKHIMSSVNADAVDISEWSVLQGFTGGPLQLKREILPQDTAYCLYTSGTTGTPKGCLLTHENTIQAMLAFQRLFAGHWTEESKWLQFASFHFDVSVLEQFWSWSVGICVASAPRDLIFEDIPGAIRQLGITHIDLTPSLARLLHPEDVPSLWKGVFITGGEQLKQEILDVWGEYACIYNGYGPTEATIGVTMYPRVPRNGKPSNIGPQFDNVGSFVLKPGTDIPVIRGGVGELCVSGKLVGKGYLNRPELTKERFPTLKRFNERVYRTGDLVRILHDGTFIFLGRADDQVKLRGQRLELSEINEVGKKSRPDIDEVVTLVLKHNTQAKEQLVTFFTVVGQDERNIGDVILATRNACKARLPGYMVPTHFVPMKALPLNANNKADTKQLAAFYNNLSVDDLQRLGHSSSKDKEWNEAERKALAVIARIIDTDQSVLSRESNIFELGLDSISMIAFSRALQNAGYENAKLSIVKNNPSMDRLVGAIISGSSDQSRDYEHLVAAQEIAAFAQKHILSISRDLGVEASEIECIAPCTPVQEGMIYQFLENDSALYFNRFRYRLEVNVDTEKLLAAWGTLASQLQVLRTKFVATDDGFAQVVTKMGDGYTNGRLGYDTMEKAQALNSPWSLGISGSTNQQVLELRMFHGLYDGNSMNMMLNRLFDEYKSITNIEYGPPFHSSLSHGPLVKNNGAEEFWKSHLGSWSYHPIPCPHEDSADVVATSHLKDLNGFEDMRKSLAVAPQAMIQAAWISILQTIVSPNLTMGLVTSGRAIDFHGAEKVIGPLFNTVPFHISIASGKSMSAVIRQCHEFNMKMQDYQHTPLKEIQKWSSARVGQSLFDSLFVFQRPEKGEDHFGEGIWEQIDEENIADYPLALEATLNHDSTELALTIVAKGAVMTQGEANDLLEKIEVTVRSILAGEDQTITTSLQKDLSDDSIVTAIGQSSLSNAHLSTSFEWTEQAKIIRNEISILANIEQNKVHEHSSIFELGLDSIDVIKLSTRIRKQGIHVSVSSIIKLQTVANICSQISISENQSEDVSSGKKLAEISQELKNYLGGSLPDDVEDVLPATPLQQSMVSEMTRSGFTRYFNIEFFELGEGVDEEKLRQAVNMVITKSPILRTTFTEVDDPQSIVSYAQIVHRDLPKSIINVVAEPMEDIQQFMKRVNVELVLSASIDRGLFQVQFTSIAQNKYMIMAISHALYDGRSLRAIHEDIQKAYRGMEIHRPASSPFLEQVFNSTTDEAKTFWKTTLSNLPSATFPKRDIPKPENEVVYRLEKRSRISLKDIESVCKSSRITLQTLGQTCWALVLAQMTSQLDVVFGSVLSCRDTEEADQVLFPLMNTVTVRSVLHGNLGEMLRYMQEMSDTTRQFQHFPLATAQVYAMGSRGGHREDTTLFDTLFIYQGKRQPEEKDPLYRSVGGKADVEFPVCVEMEIVDEEYLVWTTACKAMARDEKETEDLLVTLDSVLERIVTDTQSPVITTDAEGICICELPKFQARREEKLNIRHHREEFEQLAEDTPWTETQLKIRTALRTISGVAEGNIHKDSTIFHLGLDSILVLKLPALLRKDGIQISVSDIMRYLTIEDIAEYLNTQTQHIQEKEEAIDIDSILISSTPAVDASLLEKLQDEIGDIQYMMPVTAGQLFMLRHWRNSDGELFYPTFKYRVSTSLDREKLEYAWKSLLQQHDILRTGFVEMNSGDFVQVVFRNFPNEITYLDQTKPRPDDEKMGENLNCPPLNLKVTGSNGELHLRIHHALYDGISISILIHQLQALYNEQSLPPPSPSASGFREFVAKSVISMNSSSTKQKWIEYLGGASSPSSHASISSTKNRSQKRTSFFYPSVSVSRLAERARKMGVAVDHLLVAAVARLVCVSRRGDARVSGVDVDGDGDKDSDMIIGIYLANRAAFGEDFSTLQAPTLCLLPLKVHVPIHDKKADISEYEYGHADADRGRDTNDEGIAQIAKEIQRDLGMLSADGGEMMTASLEQIKEWTGVGVGVWINVLRDVDLDGGAGDDAGNDEEVESEKMVFEQIVDMGMGIPGGIIDIDLDHNLEKENEKENVDVPLPTVSAFSKATEMEAKVSDKDQAYGPSIDIEIRYDSHSQTIDVGFFGPEDMVRVDEAREWISGMRRLLC